MSSGSTDVPVAAAAAAAAVDTTAAAADAAAIKLQAFVRGCMSRAKADDMVESLIQELMQRKQQRINQRTQGDEKSSFKPRTTMVIARNNNNDNRNQKRWDGRKPIHMELVGWEFTS